MKGPDLAQCDNETLITDDDTNLNLADENDKHICDKRHFESLTSQVILMLYAILMVVICFAIRDYTLVITLSSVMKWNDDFKCNSTVIYDCITHISVIHLPYPKTRREIGEEDARCRPKNIHNCQIIHKRKLQKYKGVYFLMNYI